MHVKCLFNETATYFDDILAICQCVLRKVFRSRQCLIVLVEKWGKKIRDTRGSFLTLATDFSESFDFILHDLLIAKLCAHIFDIASLKLIYTYLRGS